MALDPLTLSLLAAIGTLASACASLYLRGEKLHATLSEDRHRASELIFALLQKSHDERGERAPPTITDWDDEPTTGVVDRAFIEAKAHATREVNGDLELLCRRYLQGADTPIDPRRIDHTLKVSDNVIAEAEKRIAERKKQQ